MEVVKRAAKDSDIVESAHHLVNPLYKIMPYEHKMQYVIVSEKTSAHRGKLPVEG